MEGKRDHFLDNNVDLNDDDDQDDDHNIDDDRHDDHIIDDQYQ